MDYLDLGSSPSDESCAQLGVGDDYPVRARRECRALINQMKRTGGEPPPGTRFRIMANPHDFGTYYSVVIEYDEGDEAAAAYAYHCEGDAPASWDGPAREELGLI